MAPSPKPGGRLAVVSQRTLHLRRVLLHRYSMFVSELGRAARGPGSRSGRAEWPPRYRGSGPRDLTTAIAVVPSTISLAPVAMALNIDLGGNHPSHAPDDSSALRPDLLVWRWPAPAPTITTS